MSDLELLADTMQGYSITSGDHHMQAAAAIRELIKLQAAQAQAGDGEAPVAWLCDAGDGENINATCSLTALADYKRFGRKITPLYKKQPAQANQQLLDALEAVLECGSTTDQWWVDQARAAITAAQEGK